MSDASVNENLILMALKKGDPKMLASVYKKSLPMITAYVKQNNGSQQDGEDICQDAIFIFTQNIQKPDFVLSSEASTYIMAIAKNLWLKKLTSPKLNQQLAKAEIEFQNLSEDDEQEVNQLIRIKQLSHALQQLGEPCHSLLKHFYFLKKTMTEIAEYFHYTNPENAKNQKYKCLQRLKKMMS